MEFESFHSGTLLHIGIQEGEGAKVDTLLAIIGQPGEDISSLLGAGGVSKEVISELPKEVVSNNTSTVSIPKGVEIVTMPRLSDTMTEGTVAGWLKKVGDEVVEGDILAEIETDKATMEFESFYKGTLLYIGIEEGGSAPVDSVLAVIGPKGTDIKSVLAALEDGVAHTSSTEEVSSVNESPKATNTVDIPSIVNDGGRVFASPLAKRIAQEKGINLAEIRGTGENGRIVKKDVENFTPQAVSTSEVKSMTDGGKVASVMPFVPAGQESFEEVKNSQMRKTIAKRLGESKFTAPHYYLTIEVDMENAMASRSFINALPDTKVSFNDMVVKACAMALKNTHR